MLSVILMNVAMCRSAECHYSESQGTIWSKDGGRKKFFSSNSYPNLKLSFSLSLRASFGKKNLLNHILKVL
jgi:hypothetical protein